jgi:hypothetical protein
MHQLLQNFIQHPSVKINSTHRKITGDHTVDWDITDQLLITYSAFSKYFRNNGNTKGQYISHFGLQESHWLRKGGFITF